MRIIPNCVTENTVSIYKRLNKMSKSEIVNMRITIFAENFPHVSYGCVYHAVRTYRSLNRLF